MRVLAPSQFYTSKRMVQNVLNHQQYETKDGGIANLPTKSIQSNWTNDFEYDVPIYAGMVTGNPQLLSKWTWANYYVQFLKPEFFRHFGEDSQIKTNEFGWPTGGLVGYNLPSVLANGIRLGCRWSVNSCWRKSHIWAALNIQISSN